MILAKLNKPSLSGMPPSNVFEINITPPPPPARGLIEDLRYLARDRPGFKILMQIWTE